MTVEHGPDRVTAITLWGDDGPLLVAPVPIGQRPAVIEVDVPGLGSSCTVVATTESGAIAACLPPFRVTGGSTLTVTLVEPRHGPGLRDAA